MCFAQSADVQAKIAEIRKAYNNQKEWIETMLSDEYIPDDYVSAKIRHNIAGAGQSDGTVDFYFNDDFDEDIGRYVSYLNFVRRTIIYTIAESKTYEEYLYDDEGLPAFYYASFRTVMDSEVVYVEMRVYYDKGVQIHCICKVGKDMSSLKEVKANDEFVEYMAAGLQQFGTLKESFNKLMN